MAHFPKFWGQKGFFWWIWLSRKTSYGFLAPCQNLDKTNDPIPRNQSDKRKDRMTDRPYFIGPSRLPPGVQINTCFPTTEIHWLNLTESHLSSNYSGNDDFEVRVVSSRLQIYIWWAASQTFLMLPIKTFHAISFFQKTQSFRMFSPTAEGGKWHETG